MEGGHILDLVGTHLIWKGTQSLCKGPPVHPPEKTLKSIGLSFSSKFKNLDLYFLNGTHKVTNLKCLLQFFKLLSVVSFIFESNEL